MGTKGGFSGKWLGGIIYWRDLGSTGPTDPDNPEPKPQKPSGPTYWIRKKIQGHPYKVSTRCSTERAALKELERFEGDPGAYQPGGETAHALATGPDPIFLKADLSEAYLNWCRDVQGNSLKWLNKQKNYLAWWSTQLKGVDLRRASLVAHIENAIGPDLKPDQPGYHTRAKRIAIIKGLYSYMRLQKHARDRGFCLGASEDPTFGTLAVPQSDSDSRQIRDKAAPKKNIMKILAKLEGHWKDAFLVQAATGWHVEEIYRFTAGRPIYQDGQEVRRVYGSTEPPKRKAKGIAGVLVCPEAKIGGEMRTAVSTKALEAAKRLLERGSFSVEKYGLAVKAACKEAGIPDFTPGRMRHTVATHAIDSGADIPSVSTFLNHKSPATTRVYAKLVAPKPPPTII